MQQTITEILNQRRPTATPAQGPQTDLTLQPRQKSGLPSSTVNATRIIKTDDHSTAISLYSDDMADKADVAGALNILNAAFPRAFSSADERNAFFALLASRVIDNGFTKKRLKDAIYHFIDTGKAFKQILISDIISFDKLSKIMTYNEACEYVQHKDITLSDLSKIKIDGKIYYQV